MQEIPGPINSVPPQQLSMYHRQTPTPFPVQEQKAMFIPSMMHQIDPNINGQQQQPPPQQMYNQGTPVGMYPQPPPPQQQQPQPQQQSQQQPPPPFRGNPLSGSMMAINRIPMGPFGMPIAEYMVEEEPMDLSREQLQTFMGSPGGSGNVNPAVIGGLDNGNKPGSKALRNSKRAVQNRNAQKAFRLRKERYIKLLENKSRKFDELMKDVQRLKTENLSLKNRIWELEDKLKVLTASNSPKDSDPSIAMTTGTAVGATAPTAPNPTTNPAQNPEP